MRIIKHSGLTVATCAALAFGVGSVASGSGDLPFSNNDPGTDAPAAPSRALAQSITPSQAAPFAALRAAPEAADAPPPSVASFLARGLRERYGVNVALARHGAHSAGASADIYLVPGNGVVCTIAVMDAGTGGGCVDNATAAAGGLVGTDSWQDGPGEPEHVVVSGMVPDGVGSVVVATADGAQVKAAVQDNAYAAELVGQVPDRVTWADSSGRSHTEDVPYQAG